MIYSTETGPSDGEPIVFLHAGSYSGTMWRSIARQLPEMRCILPDLPGHGQSRDMELASLDQAADCVASLISEKYGDGPVNIVGLSFGAYAGLILMARHPSLVRRAMLSGIHLGSIPNPARMNAIVGVMSPLIRFGWFRRKMAEPLGITEKDIYNRSDGTANVTAKTLRSAVRLVSVFDVQDVLPSIHTTTLMIAGGREHSSILGSLSEYRRLMPDCTARTAPGMGHAWCVQDQDLFVETVRAWVSQAPLPDRLASVNS